jgi:hypothetical protein
MQKKYLVIFDIFSCIFSCISSGISSGILSGHGIFSCQCIFSCIFSCIFDAYSTYSFAYSFAYLSNQLHISAICFRFRASSDLIALLVHARFNPCHGCFLVPVPFKLSVCSRLLCLVLVSAGSCREVGSYVSFNLKPTPPASCCSPVAEAEAVTGSQRL